MNSIIKVAAAVNRVSVGDAAACAANITELISFLDENPCDIVLLPQLSLCSPACGSLFYNSALHDTCMSALEELMVETVKYSAYIVVGLVISDSSNPVSVVAVLQGGKLVSLIRTQDNPTPLDSDLYSDNILPCDTVFSVGNLRFSILAGDPLLLPVRASALVGTGVDLILVPSYMPVTAGYTEKALKAVEVTSRTFGCAVAVANGGVGDTSSPYIYRGFTAIYECGELLTGAVGERDSFCVVSDLDTDIIRSQKRFGGSKTAVHSVVPACKKVKLDRILKITPFIPQTQTESYLHELFKLQTMSVVSRLENTGIKKLAVAVSGGLDSTMTLLVAAAAADTLGLPRSSVIGVTLPGFGTTTHTKSNALLLMEALGVTSRDIPIGDAIRVHFTDIGYDINSRDVTYENAQARERTQIMLDIANMEGALVLGTGDLSEEALGFCTFGGDNLAHYNTNVCLPKTTIRILISFLVQENLFGDANDVLEAILATPVSPELLPPDEDGASSQKTEEILGPYELHDFFLYYFVRYGFRPSKLYYYACMAFSGSYMPDFIKEKLVLFLKRFAPAQFKRSLAPDSASITDVNLNSCSFHMPSDMNFAAFISEIEDINF